MSIAEAFVLNFTASIIFLDAWGTDGWKSAWNSLLDGMGSPIVVGKRIKGYKDRICELEEQKRKLKRERMESSGGSKG